MTESVPSAGAAYASDPYGPQRMARWKRWLLMIVGLVLLIGAIAGVKAMFVMKAMSSFHAPPPPVVTTAKVSLEPWTSEIESVGSLRAVRGVDLAAEAAGTVRSVQFHAGDWVAAGAVLVELNTDAERAQLLANQAAADLARITLNRTREQFAAHVVTQAMIDNDEADLRGKNAMVEQEKALIDRKIIRAPFAGRVGISTINPGQYLNSGDKVVSLQAIDTLYVDFTVPQREAARVVPGAKVIVRADGFPDRRFEGRVDAVQSIVDVSTRNLQVEASVPNPRRELLPGMFVKAALVTGAGEHFLTVPQSCLTYNAYGTTLFVADSVKDDKGGEGRKARQVFVTTGATRGDQVAILAGLKEGEEVVTLSLIHI